ncbi:MAG: hypothetical protein ACYSWU_00900 [Planctomycetota bacterium]|jgi:hypothetical protein
MSLTRKLVDGEMFSTVNKEPVKCAACKRDAEYTKSALMEGDMEVCHTHRGLPVWRTVGMKHTVLGD